MCNRKDKKVICMLCMFLMMMLFSLTVLTGEAISQTEGSPKVHTAIRRHVKDHFQISGCKSWYSLGS